MYIKLKDYEQNVFELKEFLLISIKICDALEKIHAENIVYRAINPSNILYEQKTGEVKIIDCNSDKYLSSESYVLQHNNTLEKLVYYISPEQTGKMNRTIDYRSDFYSLGIVFYEMLTGRLPFESEDPMDIIYSHVAKEPRSISKINSSIPKVVCDIIEKLIAKNPEERYKSASGLKRDLEKCLMQIENNSNVSFELGKYDLSGKFYIPQKLYSREKEIQRLMESFDRVTQGSGELFLISGAPGVGKSVLVQEFYNSVKQKNGYFIMGKFEQFQNDSPYSAIIQALDNLINQMLVECSSKLETWKKSILQAVGNNGQVIVDVLPNLELIIGKQVSISQLGAVETQNRFNLVFQDFMKIIATKEHPLIMFIDDWQWADSASLNLINMLLTDKSNKYLLVIGTYRNNNSNLLRPIMSFIDELTQNKIIYNTINLNVLQKNDVKLLLEDTLVGLNQDLNDFEELSGYICNKTEGNPFFVKQFLRSLYDLGYLWFDYNLMKWNFDTEEIKKMNITENVIDLLNSKIKTLNPLTIQWLKYGACMGNQFDLQTLALINDKPYEFILDSLQEAMKIGLIYDLRNSEKLNSVESDIKFKFVHDRIQQAVYFMISEEEKCDIHLQLGEFYLKSYIESNKSEQLFETVRQFNAGSKIITDECKRVKLAELNLNAGILAKKSAAYSVAYIYFKEGIKLLSNSNGWQDFYDLTLQLYSEITEASYLISDYMEMDKFAEIVLQKATSLVDKIGIYKIKIDAYQAQLNLKEALNTGISVLRLMDININIEPTQSDIEKAFANVWEAISELKVDDLVNLPTMTDPEKIGAMQILLSSISATYKAAPMLTPIIICKMIELMTKHGNAPFAPAVYSFYSFMLCSSASDIKLGDKLEKYVEIGYKLGRTSINLIENESMKIMKAMVLNVDNVAVKHWKEHIRLTLKPFIEGYENGIENGNFEYGGYCLAMHDKNLVHAGEQLEVIEKEIEINIKRLQKIKQGLCVNYESIFGQFVQNMQDKSKNHTQLIGDLCNENEMFHVLHDMGDIAGITFLFLSKMMLNYYFQNYTAAIEYGEKTEQHLGGVAGMIDIAIFYFYDSLARLAVHSTLTKEEQEQNLAKVNENQARMSIWSKLAPMNFLHKFYLVQGELCKINGNYDEAKECYDKSINLAKENEYLNDEALAYELAGKFYLDEHKSNTAKVYLREARNKYQFWGAIAKVKDLEDKYPNLFLKTKESIDTTQNIDMFSIMKASQAISSEINLDGLLSSLMTVMLENMGAQRGFLILKRGEELFIEAHVDATCNKKEILTAFPIDKCEKLPKTVIRFTARTGESIVFPNGEDKCLFSKDEYIINKRPKSFFSTAVKLKNEIKGVLYLENNLIEGIFKPNKVKVIEILSTQAAISLENAMHL